MVPEIEGSNPSPGAKNKHFRRAAYFVWYNIAMNRDFVENIAPNDYKIRGSYSLAKKMDLGDYCLIFVSGVQAPKDENHRVTTDNIEEQTTLVFEDIAKILSQANATLDDVVKAVIYITDMNDFDKISKIRSEYFSNSMPVSTLVEVNRMTRDGAKIEIEVTAIVKKKVLKAVFE